MLKYSKKWLFFTIFYYNFFTIFYYTYVIIQLLDTAAVADPQRQLRRSHRAGRGVTFACMPFIIFITYTFIICMNTHIYLDVACKIDFWRQGPLAQGGAHAESQSYIYIYIYIYII